MALLVRERSRGRGAAPVKGRLGRGPGESRVPAGLPQGRHALKKIILCFQVNRCWGD